LIPIYGGLLIFESDWIPPLGESPTEALGKGEGVDHLDFGAWPHKDTGISRKNIDTGLISVGNPPRDFSSS
jgi:hypothetical protein